jgi:exodeoxyribonuclease V alpha subunit
VENLSGSVERIIYYNAENGYGVLSLRPEKRSPEKTAGVDRQGLVTVAGSFPEISQGEFLKLEGEWKEHPRFGRQFQVEAYEQSAPITLDGIRRYLGSGLIKGIGPRLAERIVAQFGIDTLRIIENEPRRLRDTPDIGRKRAGLIAAAWEDQKHVKQIMLFLHSHAISSNLAVKIYKKYGEEALSIVKNDPYRLARDIHGVGFRTADRIARSMGLSVDHPSRIEAGILFMLEALNGEGHVFAERNALLQKTAELLGVGNYLLPASLNRLEQDELVTLDTLPSSVGKACAKEGAIKNANGHEPITAVYPAQFYYSEKGIAQKLRLLSNVKPPLVSIGRALYLDPILSQDQQEAVKNALLNPVSILTGGPGTGKTTCLKALIASLELARKTYALASPTGRAAKRLSEATGRPASTIHRLLGYKPGEGFKYNADNPLPVDMLVLDEVSMLDLMLAHHLMKALQPGTHLLLVGDIDQLPSVGAGDVLRDIIASGKVPTSRLEAIFRQAAHSQIITNAHRINRGEMPVFSPSRSDQENMNADFFLFPAETPEDTAGWVEDVVCNRIPQKFGMDPFNDIQVIAPMYRGPAGVTALNNRLQSAVNPPGKSKPEKVLFGQMLRLGDKLMQTQNNYDKDVYNGDMGRLTKIDLVEQTLAVNFDGRVVVYEWSESDQLVLAYAVSVHKAQGSEFPAVVLPLVTQHFMMLQRNLLYTAVTRARQLCVLVGSRKAVSIAVKNSRESERCTALGWRLTQHNV